MRYPRFRRHPHTFDFITKWFIHSFSRSWITFNLSWRHVLNIVLCWNVLTLRLPGFGLKSSSFHHLSIYIASLVSYSSFRYIPIVSHSLLILLRSIAWPCGTQPTLVDERHPISLLVISQGTRWGRWNHTRNVIIAVHWEVSSSLLEFSRNPNFIGCRSVTKMEQNAVQEPSVSDFWWYKPWFGVWGRCSCNQSISIHFSFSQAHNIPRKWLQICCTQK